MVTKIFFPKQINLKFKNMNKCQLLKYSFNKNSIVVAAPVKLINKRNESFLILNKFGHVSTYLKILKNIIIGLKRGYVIRLELVGVGYKAEILDGNLALTLGYSHNVFISVPRSIVIEIKKSKFLTLRSFNYQLLTQFISNLRALKIPDVYKGKGVRYKNEGLVLKEGKKKK